MKKKLLDTTKTLVNYAEEAAEHAIGKGGSTTPSVKIGYGGVALESIQSEEEEDMRDALCPIYDQLRLAPYWWVLELLPLKLRVQRDDDKWDREWT